jgi:hypothetical protein
MHPDYARADYGLRHQPTHAELRREEHAAAVRAGRLGRPRGSRRWKLNWTTLSPRDVAGGARQGASTWTIIISASRPHRARHLA